METANTEPQIKARKTKTFNLKREMIKLEKDVPLPENLTASTRGTYPLGDLGVNDSFSFQYASGLKSQMLKSVNNTIRDYVKKNPAKQFVARIIEGEGVIRVWRISDVKDEPN